LQACFASPTLAAFREAAGAAYGGFHVIAVDEAQFFPGALRCVAVPAHRTAHATAGLPASCLVLLLFDRIQMAA
jgi:hypothetical protein